MTIENPLVGSFCDERVVHIRFFFADDSTEIEAIAARNRIKDLAGMHAEEFHIAPNTHAQLESFYAVPQIGAVLVPINYRLTADDFVYLINHSGRAKSCAFIPIISRRSRAFVRSYPTSSFSSCLKAREGWLDYEGLLGRGLAKFSRPDDPENDLLTINYTSGTTSRPKGVMITHRNAWMNVVGTLMHHEL